MNRYRIYTLGEDGRTKRFYGIDSEKGDVFEYESDEGIIEKVREMRSGGDEFMWQTVHSISVLDKDGKVKKTYESFEEQFKEFDEKRKNRKPYEVAWDWICGKWHMARDMWFEVKCGFERMFRKYDRTVAWNMDSAIIDLIKKNIPRLVENMHGCPTSYVKKAVKTLNPDISDEEAEKSSGNNEQLNVAMAMWKSDLESLVEHCKLIGYYECYGKQLTTDEDWVDPTKYKIPHKEFSEEIDYNGLSTLVEKNYDWIFDFLRKHFTELWD